VPHVRNGGHHRTHGTPQGFSLSLRPLLGLLAVVCFVFGVPVALGLAILGGRHSWWLAAVGLIVGALAPAFVLLVLLAMLNVAAAGLRLVMQRLGRSRQRT